MTPCATSDTAGAVENGETLLETVKSDLDEMIRGVQTLQRYLKDN